MSTKPTKSGALPPPYDHLAALGGVKMKPYVPSPKVKAILKAAKNAKNTEK